MKPSLPAESRQPKREAHCVCQASHVDSLTSLLALSVDVTQRRAMQGTLLSREREQNLLVVAASVSLDEGGQGLAIQPLKLLLDEAKVHLHV